MLDIQQQTKKISKNGIGDINIQHMTGIDKNIENYEQMVGHLFIEQRQAPQRVAVWGRSSSETIVQNQ